MSTNLGLIPALTPQEWGRLVYALSEETNAGQQPCLVSNEARFQDAISRLRAHVAPGHAYIGVGPEQNLTYVAATEPRVVFLVDSCQETVLLWVLYITLIRLADTPAGFVSALFGRKIGSIPAMGQTDAAVDEVWVRSIRREVRSEVASWGVTWLGNRAMRGIIAIHEIFVRRGPSMTQSVGRGLKRRFEEPSFADLALSNDDVGRQWGFLTSLERFTVIKELAMAMLLIPVAGALEGTHSLRAIGDWLRSHGCQVGTCYVSNADAMVRHRGNWTKWTANLLALPRSNDSVVLRSGPGRPVVQAAEVLMGTWVPPDIEELVTSFLNREAGASGVMSRNLI